MAWVDTAEIIHAALARQRKKLASHKLVVSVPDDLPLVNADQVLIEQALGQALDNAVKYSREHVRVEVEVGKGEQDLAVIRVRDQGIGIPPNETKRIFGRFYRTPWALTQRVKGTGLGLFIVAQTAKRHGGRAFAQSDGVGRGATFTLELPSAPAVRSLPL